MKYETAAGENKARSTLGDHLKIDGIVLRELSMRLKHPFTTSREVTWGRRILPLW